ncbi:MAG: DUF2784 domain-containing protein [Acidobacteriota bacterium]
MFYRTLADLVVLLHLAFIAFVLVGGFLALRWRRLAWLHLPAACWGGLVELTGWFCPLTPLENRLRRASGTMGYSDGFIEHYVLPLIYPADLTREQQVLLGLLLLAVNLAAYTLVWRQHSRGTRAAGESTCSERGQSR